MGPEGDAVWRGRAASNGATEQRSKDNVIAEKETVTLERPGRGHVLHPEHPARGLLARPDELGQHLRRRGLVGMHREVAAVIDDQVGAERHHRVEVAPVLVVAAAMDGVYRAARLGQRCRDLKRAPESVTPSDCKHQSAPDRHRH